MSVGGPRGEGRAVGPGHSRAAMVTVAVVTILAMGAAVAKVRENSCRTCPNKADGYKDEAMLDNCMGGSEKGISR
eukprot:368190-Ditylum_brightwellii.AAC.1